jgi:hypothetical protein
MAIMKQAAFEVKAFCIRPTPATLTLVRHADESRHLGAPSGGLEEIPACAGMTEKGGRMVVDPLVLRIVMPVPIGIHP